MLGGRSHSTHRRHLVPWLVLPPQCSRSCPVLTSDLGMTPVMLGSLWRVAGTAPPHHPASRPGVSNRLLTALPTYMLHPFKMGVSYMSPSAQDCMVSTSCRVKAQASQLLKALWSLLPLRLRPPALSPTLASEALCCHRPSPLPPTSRPLLSTPGPAVSSYCPRSYSVHLWTEVLTA